MNRKTTVVSVLVVIVVVAAAVLVVVTQLSTGYTSKVNCVDSMVTVFVGSTFTNGSQAYETVTSVTSFTTTTNASAPVGHVTAENFSGHVLLTGYAVTHRSCTYAR